MKKFFALLLVCLATSTHAGSMPTPEGQIILTLSGKILHTQNGHTARFDLEQLKKLPSQTFNLQTRWDDEVHEYHGPLLSSILEHVGAKGSFLKLSALNDYSIEIDRPYIDKYQPILAWQSNGKRMTVRNKGPLWLLLPHDKFPELNEEFHTGRMIWQLSHIEIK